MAPDPVPTATPPTGSGLTALEIASGLLLGPDRSTPRLPRGDPGGPGRALEAAVLPALRHWPCGVSFSGGVDSSVVLVVATRVARREGLSDPIPVTLTFPDVAEASEGPWQEGLVSHLRLADWVRIAVTTELDVAGPVARQVLTRLGLVWPSNTHFHLPILEAVAGGSLLTGVGGDEVFSPARLARAADPRVCTRLRRIAGALSPERVRRAAAARTVSAPATWLTPPAAAALARELAAHVAGEPWAYGAGLAHWFRSRYRVTGHRSLAALATMTGTRLVHPLSDAGFVATLAEVGGRLGPSTRREAVGRLLPGVLPEAILDRRGKAVFDRVFATGHARRAATAWDGTGFDEAIVDAGALRRAWLSPAPAPGSLLALQATLVAAGPGDEPVSPVPVPGAIRDAR